MHLTDGSVIFQRLKLRNYQKFLFFLYFYHCFKKSWEIEPTIKFIGQLIVRRGENKILLSACRLYFSNVTFLCVLFFLTEKLFPRQSGWYSGNILRKSQMSCDKLLRNFLSSSSVSLSRLASRPAMTRLINEVWAGTRHITRRIKEDTIVHKARIEETFSTFYPTDSLQWWIKKQSDSKNANWNIDWTTEFEYPHTEPEREERVNPRLCRPGLSSEHVPHVPSAQLSLPHPEICRINEWKEMQRHSYVSLPARLREQRGNLPNINHLTWRKSQEREPVCKICW